MISKMWLLGTSFFVGIIAFGCSQVWAQDPGETGFHASLDGEFRYGNTEGFVQIPRGDGAGSTSSERPKFDEMGINQAAIGAPSLTLGVEQSQYLCPRTHHKALRLGCSRYNLN